MRYCGICKDEAVLVNPGKDVGEPYYYCRKCKLEEKEWRAKDNKNGCMTDMYNKYTSS